VTASAILFTEEKRTQSANDTDNETNDGDDGAANWRRVYRNNKSIST